MAVKRKDVAQVKKYKLFDESGGTWIALQVLEFVAQDMPDELAERCDVRLYTNCREEGYTICVRREKPKGDGGEDVYAHATFSEYRNSDEIVLYRGGNTDPGFGTNTMCNRPEKLKDKEYAEKMFFKPTAGGVKQAVEAIVFFLGSV